MLECLREKQLMWVLQSLRRYWSRNQQTVQRLPIKHIAAVENEPTPPKSESVRLPDWARDLEADGGLAVPSHLIAAGEAAVWQRVAWWDVVWWYLHGVAERQVEAARGPIHSYSFRLRDWDHRFWERAWVNRIALFLRRWAARREETSEHTLFGPLPSAELIVTHDVDAIRKTPAIRLKQTAFHTFNALRALRQGRIGHALEKLWDGISFGVQPADYWCFDLIHELEEAHGIRSQFNVYAGSTRRLPNLREFVFDPSYSPREQRLRSTLRQLQSGGWTIGLHQSFDCFADVDRMNAERGRLEAALDLPITSCRQHWLRFSWEETWKTQQSAGLKQDTTLGFNDRPGFRNGAALSWNPWDPETESPMQLTALPMVLMDSHVYDYNSIDAETRSQWIRHWVDEVRAVHGTATFIWHQRVLSSDYGWNDGFHELLAAITGVAQSSRHAA